MIHLIDEAACATDTIAPICCRVARLLIRAKLPADRNGGGANPVRIATKAAILDPPYRTRDTLPIL